MYKTGAATTKHSENHNLNLVSLVANEKNSY